MRQCLSTSSVCLLTLALLALTGCSLTNKTKTTSDAATDASNPWAAETADAATPLDFPAYRFTGAKSPEPERESGRSDWLGRPTSGSC